MIPNAYCKIHDEIEPQDNTELWVCPECSNTKTKLIEGMKPLDYAIKKIEEKLCK